MVFHGSIACEYDTCFINGNETYNIISITPYAFFQILDDFTGQFTHLKHDEFIQKWPMYGPRLRTIVNHGKERMRHTVWSRDVEEILLVLKMFPIKKKCAANQFADVIKQLIVFAEVKLELIASESQVIVVCLIDIIFLFCS